MPRLAEAGQPNDAPPQTELQININVHTIKMVICASVFPIGPISNFLFN